MTAQGTDGGNHDGRGRGSPARIVELAKAQLEELVGRRPESVSGLVRDEDGWRVTLEVVEVERVPPTTSVLGSYEALVDPEGNLLEYSRVRRYVRSQVHDDGLE